MYYGIGEELNLIIITELNCVWSSEKKEEREEMPRKLAAAEEKFYTMPSTNSSILNDYEKTEEEERKSSFRMPCRYVKIKVSIFESSVTLKRWKNLLMRISTKLLLFFSPASTFMKRNSGLAGENIVTNQSTF